MSPIFVTVQLLMRQAHTLINLQKEKESICMWGASPWILHLWFQLSVDAGGLLHPLSPEALLNLTEVAHACLSLCRAQDAF